MQVKILEPPDIWFDLVNLTSIPLIQVCNRFWDWLEVFSCSVMRDLLFYCRILRAYIFGSHTPHTYILWIGLPQHTLKSNLQWITCWCAIKQKIIIYR